MPTKRINNRMKKEEVWRVLTKVRAVMGKGNGRSWLGKAPKSREKESKFTF